MGKNKLRKFDELSHIDFVFQYPFARLRDEGFPLRGRWKEHFGNDHPIVLELGCGKGEYTVGLARRDPSRNYIGIDIKGARMHSGATAAQREGLANVAIPSIVNRKKQSLSNFLKENTSSGRNIQP